MRFRQTRETTNGQGKIVFDTGNSRNGAFRLRSIRHLDSPKGITDRKRLTCGGSLGFHTGQRLPFDAFMPPGGKQSLERSALRVCDSWIGVDTSFS